MPLSPRRKVTTPRKRFHVQFTGITMVDLHTGEEVLNVKGADMVALVARNLGLSSEAIAEKHTEP